MTRELRISLLLQGRSGGPLTLRRVKHRDPIKARSSLVSVLVGRPVHPSSHRSTTLLAWRLGRDFGTRDHVRARLPLSHILLQLFQLVLKSFPKNINIESRAVVDAPYEDGAQEPRAWPTIPEPERAWNHGPERVQVLHEHERRFLETLGQGENDLANPGFRIRFSQPGEARGAAGSDFFAPSDRN